MHEVINLSLSQRANHLSTHFYNSQESFIDYNKSIADSPNDLSIFFKPSKSNGALNFTPRVHIWDLNGGFGALSQFEYYQQPRDGLELAKEVLSKSKVEKNDYQKALDEGRALPELSASDTKYWSDYSRVMYEPKSFNVLSNWEFNPDKFPDGRLTLGQEKTFTGFDIGVEEWKAVGVEFLEEKYRVGLEECDLLNGLNIVSEVDSSWGGFSSELLGELRDDYNPKNTVFTWGLYNGKTMEQLSSKETLARIRTFLALQKHSSIFIPLGVPQLPSGLDPKSMWHVSAMQNLVFDSLQILTSQRNTPVSLSTIEANITLGTNKRLVDSVDAKVGETSYEFSSKFFVEKKEPHTFSTSTIKRNHTDDDTTDEEKTKDRSKTTYNTLPYATPSSYPKGIIDTDPLTVTLATSTKTRTTLLQMRDFVRKFVRSDERADLIDELESLSTEYEHGWSGDEDESDDDY